MSHACSGEGLISLEDALNTYVEQVQPLPVEQKSVLQAQHHILAADVLAPVSLPLFTQSAVDGYALRQQDIDAGITEFELIGEIRAGIAQQLELQAGQALRIFTGGKLPASSDTVARQEIIQSNDNYITLLEPISLGADIRYQGEELKQGTILAHQGQQVTTGLIAALSMAGVQQVQVHRQPRVCVLITGDEVKGDQMMQSAASPKTESHAQGVVLEHDAQVFDANGPLISAWLQTVGIGQFHLVHVNDDRDSLTNAFEHAFSSHDLVLTTGGVSVGDYDLIRPVSMQLGAEEIFWQVAQKPGKPLYFAKYSQTGSTSAQTGYLLGLPGNPAAVFIGLYIHAQTLLNCMQAKNNPLPHWKMGQFNGKLRADSREQLLRMQYQINDQGQVVLSPLPKQQSHMLSNLSAANALVRIKPNTCIENTCYVPFLSFN